MAISSSSWSTMVRKTTARGWWRVSPMSVYVTLGFLKTADCPRLVMPGWPKRGLAWLWAHSLPPRLQPQPELPAPQWRIEPHELRQAGDHLESAANRGLAAKRLLENEVLQWALGQMRKLLNDAWELSNVRDPDRLQMLRLKLDLLKEFYIQLELLIAGGEKE